MKENLASPALLSRRDLFALAASGAAISLPQIATSELPTGDSTAVADSGRRSRTLEQHVVTTLTVKSTGTYADPYNEIDLDFHVITPNGLQYVLPAYLEGDGNWCAHFAGEMPGTYHLTSRCTPATDAGLHNQPFEVSVTPYRGSNLLYRRGRLRVSGDKHYLVHRDGTPFLWIGDTWWMALSHRIDKDGFERLLKDRVAKGFSLIQIVAGPYCETFPEANAFDPRNANSGGFPFEASFARVNPAYFNAAETKLNAISEHGLVPCIVGMWGYYLPLIGIERVKRFWRYLVARYAAYPVVWCIAGEATLPRTPANGAINASQDTRYSATQKVGWTEVMRYVRDLDPYRNPVTIHPTEFGHDQVDDPRLMDVDMLQTNHSDIYAIPKVIGMVREAVVHKPKMPVVNAETDYEGIFGFCWHPVIRLALYHTLLNGAAGFTYGANGIWQVNQAGKPYGRSSPDKYAPLGRAYGSMPWDEAMNLPGSHHIGIGARFFNRLPWWRIRNQPGWLEAPETREGEEWMIEHSKENDPWRPVAAGIARELRIIYVPMYWSSPTVRALEPDVSYTALYVDPISGEELALGAVEADNSGRWTPSQLPPDAHDWLIVLKADSLKSAG